MDSNKRFSDGCFQFLNIYCNTEILGWLFQFHRTAYIRVLVSYIGNPIELNRYLHDDEEDEPITIEDEVYMGLNQVRD